MTLNPGAPNSETESDKLKDNKMNTHDKLVSALTQWDIKQSKKRGHNSHFLGIALQALHEVEEDNPGAPIEKIAGEAFEGRLLDFILKYIKRPS